MCIKRLPQSKNEVRPKDKYMRAQEKRGPKGGQDVADEMLEGVGVFSIKRDRGLEGVVLLVEALVEPAVVKHWRKGDAEGKKVGMRLGYLARINAYGIGRKIMRLDEIPQRKISFHPLAHRSHSSILPLPPDPLLALSSPWIRTSMRPVKSSLRPQPAADPIAENVCDRRQGRVNLGPEMVKARIHKKHHREFSHERPLEQISRGRPKKRFVKRCGGLDAVLQEQAAGMQGAIEEGENGGHDLVDDVGTDRKHHGVGPGRLLHERQPMLVHPCQVRAGQFLQQA